MDLPRLEARIARLLGRRPAVSGDEAGPASRASHAPTKAGASIHSIHSVRSTAGVRSVEGRSQSAGSQDDGLGRRYIRVATDRLDALMNLAGELVVSRSRLLSRVVDPEDGAAGDHFGSAASSRRSSGFSEQHEFAAERRRGRAGHEGEQARASTSRRSAGAGGRPETGAAPAAGRLRTRRGRLGGLRRARAGSLRGRPHPQSAPHRDGQRLQRDERAARAQPGRLQRRLRALRRIISGIQGEVTRARMVPLDQLFTRLRLPVRDAATREGKDMRVASRARRCSIDKTIADALFQPMLHLVRNAVVHGIERPPTARARRQAGQRQDHAARATGVGPDRRRGGRRRRRASIWSGCGRRGAAMGLLSAEHALSDPAVRDLVFAPGLSTRDQAGAVSGPRWSAASGPAQPWSA